MEISSFTCSHLTVLKSPSERGSEEVFDQFHVSTICLCLLCFKLGSFSMHNFPLIFAYILIRVSIFLSSKKPKTSHSNHTQKGEKCQKKKFYFHRAKQLRHKFVILKNLYQKLSARNKGLLRNKWNFAKNNKRITLCCRRQCWWHHMPLNCSWAGRWPISL